MVFRKKLPEKRSRPVFIKRFSACGAAKRSVTQCFSTVQSCALVLPTTCGKFRFFGPRLSEKNQENTRNATWSWRTDISKIGENSDKHLESAYQVSPSVFFFQKACTFQDKVISCAEKEILETYSDKRLLRTIYIALIYR